jgi:hypothetical protein
MSRLQREGYLCVDMQMKSLARRYNVFVKVHRVSGDASFGCWGTATSTLLCDVAGFP